MTTSFYDNIHSTKHASKVALVTGGSSGIGLATAKRLAREGATVFITGSIAAIKGMPAFGVYAATKAALRSFARTWTTDLKGAVASASTWSPRAP